MPRNPSGSYLHSRRIHGNSAFTPLTTNLERIVLNTVWIGRNPERITRFKALLHEAETTGGSDSQDLICRLIDRFTFLTTQDYEDSIFQIAKYIADTFDLEKTLLCATTADRNKDSAQRILYDLTSTFAALAIYKVRSLNRYDVAPKENNVNALILLDEFIGSGKSIVGRVQNLRRMYQQKGIYSPPIHAIALAGMARSLRSISHNFASLNVCLPLNKGIEQYTYGLERQNEYGLMNQLESILAPISHGKSLPSMGYAQSEALYFRHAGSCPNNVFPVFWWPELIGKKPRQPLCPRAF